MKTRPLRVSGKSSLNPTSYRGRVYGVEGNVNRVCALVKLLGAEADALCHYLCRNWTRVLMFMV